MVEQDAVVGVEDKSDATRGVVLECGERLRIDAILPRAPVDDDGFSWCRRPASTASAAWPARSWRRRWASILLRLGRVVLGRSPESTRSARSHRSVPALAAHDRDLPLTQEEVEHVRHLN